MSVSPSVHLGLRVTQTPRDLSQSGVLQPCILCLAETANRRELTFIGHLLCARCSVYVVWLKQYSYVWLFPFYLSGHGFREGTWTYGGSSHQVAEPGFNQVCVRSLPTPRPPGIFLASRCDVTPPCALLRRPSCLFRRHPHMCPCREI